MSLFYGSLLWPGTSPSRSAYPRLTSSKKTQAAIIGGGVSGVLCGYMLTKSGIPAILIEQNTIASGSTSVNAGILHYSNDKMLCQLAAAIGEKNAVTFYRSCLSASKVIRNLAETMRRDVLYKPRNSLYYASKPEDVPLLQREYEMLHQNGFDAEWWGEERIASAFPFRRAAGIVTQGDGEINPFLFTHTLAEEACRNGLEIYEKSAMLSVSPSSGRFIVTTAEGMIEAEQVIYAVGYAPEQTGRHWRNAKLNRSFVIVTNPLPSLAEWHERFLLWETARPYLYMRTTPDNRIIAGGLDENCRQPVMSTQELHIRSRRLLAELHQLFPSLSLQIRYQWCGTFGESGDGLPWLGADPDRPGQYYALNYGGNGMIYSTLGAQLIRDQLLGMNNPISAIVRPNRGNR